MPVQVDGLRQAVKALEQVGTSVEDLKDVMAKIAAEAVDVMQPFIPSRSGALRASARGNRAKGKALVTIGRARVPYAGAINYGWPRRHIKAANFLHKTDQTLGNRAQQMLEQGLDDVLRDQGLS